MSYPVGRLTRTGERTTAKDHRRPVRPRPERKVGENEGSTSSRRFQPRRIACPKHKGDQVSVTGRLDYDTWDGKDGKKHSQIKIVANQVEFLAKAKGNGSAHEETRPPAPAEEEVEPGF